MNKIVWLASYPKSGNTWFRAFLAGLLSGGDEPVDINAIESSSIESARAAFDRKAGVETSNLTPQEVQRLRPRVYEGWAEDAQDTLYVKTHHAYVYTPSGEPVISARATAGALYFVRNPLDVCVSYANHLGCDVETALAHLASEAHSISAGTRHITNQVPQHVSSWSRHVQGWADAAEIRVHVVRYEDMRARPLETFGRAAAAIGLPCTGDEVARALARCTFEELRRQEAERGFREKPRSARSFFRRGEVGSWRAVLTAEQAGRIIAAHRAVMERFHYVDRDGRPVV